VCRACLSSPNAGPVWQGVRCLARTSRNSAALIFSALIIAAAITLNTLYSARGVPAGDTYYACLYGGSLSPGNTSAPPTSRGRGTQISWNAQGIAGLPGADGVSGYEPVSRITSVFAGAALDTFVSCPVGKVALGGGVCVDT